MNVTVLADALAPVLRELVDATMAPVLARLEVADRRVAELEVALKEAGIVIDAIGAKILELPKVPTVEEVAAMVPKPPTAEEVAALVPPAIAGKDADPKVIADMVKDGIAAFMEPLQRAVDDAITDVKATSDVATAEMKTAVAGLPAVPTAAEVAAFVPAPKDGKDADPEAVRAMVAEAVEALPKAKDGESVSIDDVRPLIDEIVAARVAEIPPPRDGKDADSAAVLELVVAEVQKATSGIPMPKDGKDADPAEIAAEVERQLAARPAPQDGKSVTLEEVRPLVDDAVLAAVSALPEAKVEPEAIAAEVDKVLATWERPKDGKSVTAEEVMPALQDALAKVVAALPPAKDGVGLAGMLIDRDRELVATLTDGTTKKLGPVVGKDGADGMGPSDFEMVDDGDGVIYRMSAGDKVKEWRIPKPTMADFFQYGWKDGTEYKRGALVMYGGQPWLAMADTKARPDGNSDWAMFAKKPRDGKDGVMLEPKPKPTVKLG